MTEASRAGRVERRGKGWSYVVDVAPIGAPRKQKKVGGFRTKAQAQAAMADVLSSLARGTFVTVDRKTTLSVFVETLFLPAWELKVRPSTLDSYGRLLRIHVLPRLGDIPIASVSTDMIDQLYTAMLRGETSPLGRPLSHRTVLTTHQVLSLVFAHAVRKRHLQINPCTAADRPSADSARPPVMQTWSPAQLLAFLTVTSGERLTGLWWLLATTGMRRGEALGLHWNDVDLDEGVLHLRQSLGTIRGCPELGPLKTKASNRVVHLDDETVTRLRTHRATQAADQLAVGPAYTDRGIVFADPAGDHLNPNRVSRSFTRHVTKHGMAVIRLHDLRHTWATMALSEGISPKIVQERLGHANISVTLQIYSHTSTDLHRAAAADVAALISRGRMRRGTPA